MTARFLSSGDLLVDRRAHYAQMLADAGDFAAAADLMGQTLEQAPDWPAGFMMLGQFALDAQMQGDAIAAWERAAELDPAGALGAQMHLAAHGIVEVAAQTQAAYVEALFDDYADHFEAALLQKLDYVVPERLQTLLGMLMAERGLDGFARGIDLGCGTGLMGERLRQSVSHLAGVDLSAAMVGETERKSVYDAVEQAELLAYLSAPGRIADLVTAADVFMYCPALEPIFYEVGRVLRPGGFFAFSVEKHDGPEAQMLQPSLRYAHGETAIRDALMAAGFEILSIAEEAIRSDRGQPIAGLLVVACKPDADAFAPLGTDPVTDVELLPVLN